MRAHARYATTLPCSLELPDGQQLTGFVEDISMGGVGVRINQQIDELGDFTLGLSHQGQALRLACHVRNTRDLWQTRFIHASFRRLSAHQHQVVEAIVGSLARAHSSAPERRAPGLKRLFQWLPPRT